MTDAERRIADELRKAAITRMTEAYFSGHVLSMYVQTPGGKWSRIAQRCRVVVGDDFRPTVQATISMPEGSLVFNAIIERAHT